MTDSKGVIALARKEPDAPGDIAEYEWTELEQDAESDIPLQYTRVTTYGTLQYGWDPSTRRAAWRQTS